jgi:hypothetical protein
MVSTMASQVAELVQKYCSVQSAISKDERSEIGSLCEVAKSFFQAKAKGFVLQAGGLPLLMSHSSDCTPLHTSAAIYCQRREFASCEGGREDPRVLGATGLPEVL